MAERYAGVQIYSTTVPMGGWRGTVLVAIAAAIVLALPEAQMLTLAGLAGGIGIGVWLIRRRARGLRGDVGGDGLIHLSS